MIRQVLTHSMDDEIEAKKGEMISLRMHSDWSTQVRASDFQPNREGNKL